MREKAYKTLKAVADSGIVSVRNFFDDPTNIFTAHEMLGTIDGSTATKFTVHYNLFGKMFLYSQAVVSSLCIPTDTSIFSTWSTVFKSQVVSAWLSLATEIMPLWWKLLLFTMRLKKNSSSTVPLSNPKSIGSPMGLFMPIWPWSLLKQLSKAKIRVSTHFWCQSETRTWNVIRMSKSMTWASRSAWTELTMEL